MDRLKAKNIRINLSVTFPIWDYLRGLENYSDYIRKLIEKDMVTEKDLENIE